MSTAVLPPTRDWFALPARARLGWVVLLGSMTALHALTLDLYLPAFSQLRTDLGTSAHLVQLTLTGNLVGLAVGELVVGPLSDALGRRAPLLAGLALHLAASVGCALAPSIEVLGALRVLQGLGAAAAAVTALAVAGDLFDGAGASRLIGRLLLVVGISPVLAPTLGAQMLRVVDWRGIFAVLAAAAALLALVVALRLPETLPAQRRRPAGVRGTALTYRTLLGDQATWGLVLVVGLTFSVIFSFVTGAPLVLQSLHGLDATSFSLAFAAVAASLVTGTQVPAQLATRVAPQRLVLLGLVGSLVASSALALALAVAAGAVGVGGVGGVVALMCAVLLFAGMAVPGAPALAVGRNRWAAGSAAALVGGAQFGIGACVLPLAATAGLRGDLTMALAMTAGSALALAVLVAVVLPALRRERSPGPGEPPTSVPAHAHGA